MAGEAAAESWYVRARGRILGPLSWEQLQALRERGQLARFDQVSRDRQTWLPADSLERLFPRGGGGGAFIPGGRPEDRGPKRGPEPEPDAVGFLILDDDDAGGSDQVSSSRTAGSPANESAGWYYAEAGAPQGPVSLPELERLVDDGRIGAGTLYWRSGLDQWTAGSDLPELNLLWRYEANPGAAAGGATLRPRGGAPEPGATSVAVRVNPLAIVSLALNLICFVGNIAAIAAGALALRQIARSNGTLGGRRLAIGGIALGIAGTGISVLAYLWIIGKGSG
jgi:hypothetical protein